MFISTWLLAPGRMFGVFYGTYWIVDLYHQHWKCMWLLLPRFVPRWMGNRSIGTRWWWARRLKHSPHPPAVPPWALGVVLRALSQQSLEYLASVDMKELSLKSTLLLALALAKRIRDLHAFLWTATVFASGCSHWVRRAGSYQNRGFPTGLWTLSRLLIWANVWNALSHHSTRDITSWAWLRGMSIQHICFTAGWSSQNTFARFTGWTFSPWPLKCCGWVTIHIYATSIHVFAASHSDYSAQPLMTIVLLSALNSVQLQLFNV